MNAILPTTRLRALLVGLLILSPVIFWHGLVEPFEPLKAALTQLTALALLVFVVPGHWQACRHCFSGPIGLAVGGGILAALLSTVFSLSPRQSLLGEVDSHAGLGHVLALAVVFAAARMVGTQSRWWTSASVGLAIACVYALVQMLGLDPLQWADLSEFHTWNRPASTMGHPNYLGGYAVLVLPMLLLLFVEGNRRTRVAIGLLAMVTLLVVVATLSRAAWLAALTAAITLWCLWPQRPSLRWSGAVCFGFLLIVGLAGLLLGDRFVGSLTERLTGLVVSPGRWPIWQGAWQVFLEHPWLGSGLDTFCPAFLRVRTPAYWQVEWGLVPRRAHNEFLHALATQGLVGATAYLALAATLAWTVVRVWHEQPQQRRLVAVLASILVAFYVQNLFGFAVASTSALFAVVMGLLASLKDKIQVQAPSQPGKSRVRYRVLLISCLALPVMWLIVAPLVASLLSRWGDEEPRWHGLAVRLAPWHDQFHARRAVAALHRAESATRPQQRRAGLDKARIAIESACHLAPYNAAHWLQLGLIRLELGRDASIEPDSILTAFEQAVTLDPCNSVALAEAARAAISLGMFDLAQRYLDHGLRVDSTFGPLQAERGSLLLMLATRQTPFDMRQLAEAEAVLRVSLKQEWHGDLERQDRARLMLAMALLQNHKIEEALDLATDVKRRRSDWPTVRWFYAVVLERQGQSDMALGEYLSVLRQWPDNPQALAGVARLTQRK